LFLNQRMGRYKEAAAEFSVLTDDGPGLGAVLGDVDRNGREDLLLLRGEQPPRLFLQVARGRFAEDTAFSQIADGIGGAVGGLLGDLDLDGDLDLVLLGAGREGQTGHRLLINDGKGRFAPPIAFGPLSRLPDAQGAIRADLDGDGMLELLVARAGARPQLWRAPPPEGRHWLEIIPSTPPQEDIRWIDPKSVGLLLEVKSGQDLQVASLSSSSGYLGGPPPRAHFGLGQFSQADYVRLTWPDAVLQSELEVPADQRWQVTKVSRKPSSCPVLFSWDGARFAFVSDFLGAGGLGFLVGPDRYATPDPTEDVRIPPRLIEPRGGRYLVRVAEPLEEVAYLDQVHMVVYDHPAAWEIYPDERFTVAGSAPDGRALAVADKIFPLEARNERGRDVLARVLEIDRQCAEPPLDGRFVGYAKDHWLELDFGDRLQRVDSGAGLILYLYGWVEYTYSHVNYAASQAGLAMRGPRIEVPDGSGGWKTVMPDAGFPAGLPRMMTLNVSALPIRQNGRLRIRTNMAVYWDQVFMAEDRAGPQVTRYTLRPVVASLRPFGYPQEHSPDGGSPTVYDYQRLEHGVAFKNMTGAFTRFGDVRTLLRHVDDRFVVMGRGEEIALEFDANELPRLLAGRARTLVLHTDGYCKDMDLYTALPDTVDPLPFHGMENYPPVKTRPDRPGGERERRIGSDRRSR
ncbi:MAG: CRTAC1 family protein, partial [Pirellulales bacterium]